MTQQIALPEQSRSPRPIMRTATFLNVGYGVLEAVVGGASGSSAALANGVHNFADGVSHAAHTATHIEEHGHQPQHNRVQKRRRLAAGAIMVGALLTGANAIDAIQHTEQEQLNVPALATELGAVAINASLLLAIRRRNDGTIAHGDAQRHFVFDGLAATVTSTSIAVSPFLPYADGIGGLVATGASMYLATTYAKPRASGA